MLSTLGLWGEVRDQPIPWADMRHPREIPGLRHGSPLFGLKVGGRVGHERGMRSYMTTATLASLTLLLAACVGAPDRPSSPAQPQRPTPTPAPPPAAAPVEWQYRATTPGNWTYRAENAGSTATFAGQGAAVPGAAVPSAAVLVTMRCDIAARQISVARAGGGKPVMTVRTSYGATNWPAVATATVVVATRTATDATLDQIAYSRGRFAIEVQGGDMLILPAWAEVSRVIEDCRR